MIDRLRKDLDTYGNYNPGMATGGEVEHSDQAQDAEMIKKVLQKVIDDMNSLESDRIHPKVMKLNAGSMGIEKPNENSAETPEEAEPENDQDQHGPLDPDVLKTLLERAGEADETGSTAEDKFLDLPPEIADAIKRKRGMK